MARSTLTAPPSPGFAPVRVDEVELGRALPWLRPGTTRSGASFAASLCLVRLHDRPLGSISVGLPAGGVDPVTLAERIQSGLGDEVARHLAEDELPPAEVSAQGIAASDAPRCGAARSRLLADPLRVTVVICTRGRPDSVSSTLRSILACAYPASQLEVIVVDNASAGDAPVPDRIAELEHPVRVVRETRPGLSRARNRGLSASRGEIVVFADDDVEVDRHWLAFLAAPFCDDQGVAATSGLTLPRALETPVERWTEGFGGRTERPRARRLEIAHPPPDRPLFPFTVGDLGAGRNMAFRRDVLMALGGFDPALGPGTPAHDGDDIEALLRVLVSGRAIVADPAAIVWHAHPQDYAELRDRVWGYGTGLTACLTKSLLDHPSLIGDLLRKLPAGVGFALARDSAKNVGRQEDFPRKLVWTELGGMAYGPLAYARSRFAARRAPVAAPDGRQGA
jgi:O-antigen biosynthesis protein